VHGTRGLVIDVDTSKTVLGENRTESPRTLVLWSEDGMIYALATSMHPADALQMANSLRHA
jgi:hypothetical protein